LPFFARSTPLLVVALAATAPIEPARGAFPGENGRIAFAAGAIKTIRPDDTKARRVTRPKDSQADSQPAFSPSGKRIVFVRDFFRGRPRDEKSRIYIARANGSNLHKLKPRRRPRPRYYRSPAFSPGGKRIIFQGFIRRLGWAIYTIKTDGTRLKLLTARRNRFEADSHSAFSPNGERIAFDGVRHIGPQRVRVCDIYVMRADGSGETNLTDNDNGCDTIPSFLPDGSEITFTSDHCSTGPDFVQPQICAMRADGTDVRPLTGSDDFGAIDFSFSPNGKRITFTFVDALGDWYGLWVMRADGTEQRKLVVGSDPDWGVRR
jgi:Tol biopolymer transport system component